LGAERELLRFGEDVGDRALSRLGRADVVGVVRELMRRGSRGLAIVDMVSIIEVGDMRE
jgi:hypothetical protein